MKKCFKCLCEKPLEAFYKHAAMGDGRLNKCKDCTKKDVAKHRLANLERIRQYDRLRASQPHRVAQRKSIFERWKEAHPKRRAANVKVGNALKKGLLKRQPCLVCGSVDVEGHHPDYDRPLDVVWLCVPHHRQTHALVANERSIKDAA